jgi:hypothetical protein
VPSGNRLGQRIIILPVNRAAPKKEREAAGPPWQILLYIPASYLFLP